MKINKNYMQTIVSGLLLFVTIAIIHNFSIALIGTCTILGTAIIITNFVGLYNFLKENLFNIKSIIYLENWRYYVVTTILVGLAYIFILPQKMIIVSGILISGMLVILFIYDVLRSIFKFK